MPLKLAFFLFALSEEVRGTAGAGVAFPEISS